MQPSPNRLRSGKVRNTEALSLEHPIEREVEQSIDQEEKTSISIDREKKTSISTFLSSLSLDRYVSIFDKQRIEFEQLVIK